MFRFLLDTHTFLWFITDDPKLSGRARQMIIAGGNTPLLSVASVWEIAIKVSIGRLPLPRSLDPFIPNELQRNRIGLLPIELRHTMEVARLPLHHRDPFDRLLVAQSLLESLPIVSADPLFDQYAVQRIW